MAQLYTKVKLYLEANSKNWNDEQNNIRLQNDTGTDYIHTWNVSGLAKPTDDQLATYESSATTEENNVVIKRTRKSAYGDIGDQLDEIYKDIDAWKARIKSIKDANPKE
jgi:hypothetical protein